MSKSSSSSRTIRMNARIQKEQQLKYEALKKEVLNHAPTTNCENVSEEERAKMGVRVLITSKRKAAMEDPYAMLSLIAGVEGGAMLSVPDYGPILNLDISSFVLQKK